MEKKILKSVEKSHRELYLMLLARDPEYFWGNVNTIVGDPFKETSLESLKVPESVLYFESALKGNKTLKKLEISGHADFGRGSFSNIPTLKKVKGEYVTVVGENAFKNCENLQEVEMPRVVRLCSGAFKNCKNLKLLDMPALTRIEYGACEGCENLKVKCYPWQVSFMENYFGSERLIMASNKDTRTYLEQLRANTAREFKEKQI